MALNRIYSAGFSAGALVSNMLHARYPNLIAAVYSGSGAFGNDPSQADIIHVPFGIKIPFQWPLLQSQHHGAVLMTFGGTMDRIKIGSFELLNFHNAGKLSELFLPNAGRTVLICEHEGAHALHPLIQAEEVVRFFNAHSANQASPYATGVPLPRLFSNACLVRPAIFS